MYLSVFVVLLVVGILLYIVGAERLFSLIEKRVEEGSFLMRLKKGISVLNEREARLWWRERICLIIRLSLIFIIALSLLGIVSIYSDKSSANDVITVKRPAEDSEDINLKLSARYSDETTEDINVLISKRKYTDKEIEEFFDKGFDMAFKKALAYNDDYDHIDSSLNLIKRLDDNPLNLEWQIEPDDYFDSTGQLINEVSEDVCLKLTLTLKYGKDIRSRSKYMVLYPKVLNKSELRSRNLKNEIAKINDTSPYKEVVKIPRNINGVYLNSVEDTDSYYVFLVLIILVPILLYMRERQSLKKAAKDREEKLIAGYAELVSKLLLYLKAGNTIKSAFSRIALDESSDDNPLYVELNAMVNELNSGVSESAGYEKMSKRLRLPCYTRLMNLLVQNHKKGSLKLLDMLKAERLNALKEQRDYAKKRGEEASTKLLFPMIILLVISMVIIMVPAIMSFGI